MLEHYNNVQVNHVIYTNTNTCRIGINFKHAKKKKKKLFHHSLEASDHHFHVFGSGYVLW